MVKKKKFEEEEEEQFHVEVITKARVNSAGSWDYYVKWAGYGSEADSWEPSENVEGCERLLKSFWKHVGADNEDYEEGYVVEAQDEWIKEEKEFFHAHFGQPDEVIRKKKKRRDSKVQKPAVGKAVVKKNAKGKTTLKKPAIADSDSEYEDESDSDDDRIAPSKAESSKRSRHRQSVSSSEDSDKPLRKAPRKSSLSIAKVQDSVSAAKSSKGKEPVRPRPSTPEHDPLFSEPPTPEVTANKKKLPEPAAAALASKAASSTAPVQKAATLPQTITAPTAVPPKPTAPSHKNREPKVKLLSLQMGSDAAHYTETKRRLAERAGTVPKPAPAPAPPPEGGPSAPKKDLLKSLSFKKNKSTSDAAKPQSPITPITPRAGSSQDPRKPAATGQFFSGTQETQIADSPVDEFGGGWGRDPSPPAGGGWGNTAGWGRGPSPPAGGWGNTAQSSSGDRGAPQQSPKTANFVPTSLLASQPVQHVDRPPDPRKVAMARRQSTPQEQQAQKAAEKFLASIMPEQLAAPMPEPSGNEMDVDVPAAPPPIIRKPVLPQTRISKHWEWTGELHMEPKPDQPKPVTKLCNLSLSEPSEPRPGGIRLNLCYTVETTTLKFEKFHDIADVYLLLRACAPIQQYCKVSHKAPEDDSTFKTFATYLSRRRQFTYARVYMDDTQRGVLLVVPTVVSDICNALKVPAELRTHALVAVLIPWKLTVEQYQKYEWQATHGRLNPDDGSIGPKLVSQIADLGKKVTAKPRLAQGLRLYHFTTADHDFFTRSARRYCTWNAPSDGSVKTPGFETQLLMAVLKEWKAERVGYREDVRVIFVHVGALRSLHKLEALAMRRYKRPDLRFYAYGTHPSVPPDRWGVREIYPVGGVATFSAKAIIENPFKVYDLIELFYQHPLWTCYIHPSVVAAVAKTSYPDIDVVPLLKQGKFFYKPLLELIEEGKISLLEAPPKSRQPRMAKNDTSVTVYPGLRWVEWTLGLCDLDTTGIMEECLRFFNEKHAALHAKDPTLVVEQGLIQDVLQMQLEPAIMDNYRRFVILMESSRNGIPTEHGVEFVTMRSDKPNQEFEFDFRDEYFGRS